MTFLVAKVFPPSPDDADGALIWKNILNLQEDLTNKREVSARPKDHIAGIGVLDNCLNNISFFIDCD